MNSTTGTSIDQYFSWLRTELEQKNFGEVSISFTVTHGQITDVRKMSMESDHIPLVSVRKFRVKAKV